MCGGEGGVAAGMLSQISGHHLALTNSRRYRSDMDGQFFKLGVKRWRGWGVVVKRMVIFSMYIRGRRLCWFMNELRLTCVRA